MYELKSEPYLCSGKRSCGICEDILQGFLTEHYGHVMVSDFHLGENAEKIMTAIAMCPNESLKLEEINDS